MSPKFNPTLAANARNGKIVYSTSDDLGTILVTDYQDYRALTFDSEFTQSGFNRLKPFAVSHEYIRIMLLVLGWVTPRHVTLLGLGGGSLLRSLHHHLHACNFDVVELRAKVVSIAQDYFDVPVDSRVVYRCCDANHYLHSAPSNSSDVIFSDLFDAYLMSPLQVKPVFVKHCSRVLSDDGWLVFNFHQLPLERSIFFTELKAHFQTVVVYSTAVDNHLLFAGKRSIGASGDGEGRVKRMELELGTEFMPLFEQLQRLAQE